MVVRRMVYGWKVIDLNVIKGVYRIRTSRKEIVPSVTLETHFVSSNSK